MRVVVNKRALQSIRTFYKNVLKKYSNTYSEEQMQKNVEEVCNAIQTIRDNGKKPILQKHRTKGYKEATWKRRGSKVDWYFEYKVEIDNNSDYVIHVYEAINHRNMNETKDYIYTKMIYESIMKDIAVIVKRAINEIS